MTDKHIPRGVIAVCMVGAVLSIGLVGLIWHLRFHKPSCDPKTDIVYAPHGFWSAEALGPALEKCAVHR